MPRLRCSVVCTLVVLLCFVTAGLSAVAPTWQDIAAELMSPACPGRTLLNCTSGYAEQWRELIRQKLAEGQSKDVIMQYFVEMRGEEVLAAPPKRGFALTAWLFPMLIMFSGAGLILVLTYRWAHKRSEAFPHHTTASSPPLTTAEDPYRQQLQKELEDFSAP